MITADRLIENGFEMVLDYDFNDWFNEDIKNGYCWLKKNDNGTVKPVYHYYVLRFTSQGNDCHIMFDSCEKYSIARISIEGVEFVYKDVDEVNNMYKALRGHKIIN